MYTACIITTINIRDVNKATEYKAKAKAVNTSQGQARPRPHPSRSRPRPVCGILFVIQDFSET